MSSHPCTRLIPAVLAILLTPGPLAAAGPEAGVDPFDAVSFQDGPGSREMAYPDWFKHSFLDLREDVQDLAEAEGGLRVLTSKGIHIAVPRERIQVKNVAAVMVTARPLNRSRTSRQAARPRTGLVPQRQTSRLVRPGAGIVRAAVDEALRRTGAVIATLWRG